MKRQHATPLLISADGATVTPAIPLDLGVSGHGFSEADIQDFIHRFPGCLPIAEIDPLFVGAVSVCRELTTTAGKIDNLLVTASGLPVLVECKLWKNPEGRREVIGQILDYSKELTKWSASDLQREASRRLGRKGNVLLDIVREAGHDVDEIMFNDALTFNLRRGRFLLLIVGDGIREGVEAITDYLQAHAGLHFTLGLVEMPIYLAPDGNRLVVPRVLARTQTISRTVISVPEGMSVVDDDEDSNDASDINPSEYDEARLRRREKRFEFWKDFLGGLELDDPEQMLPSPSLGGHVLFKLGAPGGSSWITVYRDVRTRPHVAGLFLSSNVNSVGERATKLLAEQASDIASELVGATVDFSQDRPVVRQQLAVRDFDDPADRERALAWLRERTNAFVNVLRPRIRSALTELNG